ncbi:hypothetical protein COW36_09980 [bacterium (Candidatus Blackallbacteria) CG17_big_fil_post_rev_8_21_14_2_50_48_46]|uniref:Uncharacterized protein n=1 Tax=bacterium (Candidatus Blackallbacteria) CG17_big_fil_post_rev_8_21_14_2_50_48_46 TaxID=2014261 RepID=A0A2M7G5D6_9BACT|nr:MAG: hypothetical protein COW64_13910 [bacterium (Candidatus Blackallbacteria) CG18_big_fil_WC_8_21_14_2_50_49_26]PIW17127.1 MAG: hypothetical protein COW36_09980 [bacterium (Candidatus Blackallbacteria) CG17_big_fil_post_rev_8_21_14_2_50_48_46]PIW47821.1 MAG: hypothetical protein COW20_11210 [bacterium (Candidatus Blackallbacteria) CG13_big_fil_rev_8_21_14_2_50_49_14]
MSDDPDFWEDWGSTSNPYFQLNREKSCIGKRIFVYHTPLSIQTSFFTDYLPSGELSFPLGEHCPFYQFSSPGFFVITGLLNDTEIRVVPRLKASLREVCQVIETSLENYGKQKGEPPEQPSSV